MPAPGLNVFPHNILNKKTSYKTLKSHSWQTVPPNLTLGSHGDEGKISI